MSELKGCPSCGSSGWTVWLCRSSKEDLAVTYYVDCGDCGFSTDHYSTEAQAIEEWNTGKAIS